MSARPNTLSASAGRWPCQARCRKIVDITDGRAELDVDGDGQADDASTLAISDAEREQLASRYAVGQALWRVPVSHFTPWDFN